MNNKTQKYKDKFCEYINQLIEAWETASDNNYKIYIYDPGYKANYLAIILNIANIDGALPFEDYKWYRHGTPIESKEHYPDLPKELLGWKEKAENLSPNAKIQIPQYKTNISKNKIERFCQTAEEALEIKELEEASNHFSLGPNAELLNKGRLLNKLAVDLGLFDPAWYLVHRIGIKMTYGPHADNEWVLRAYEELDIDTNCPKLPYAVFDDLTGNGGILEEDLQKLVVKAKSLLDSLPLCPKNDAKIFKNSTDFRTVTATITFTLTEDQAKCIEYLRREQKRGITEVSGDEILCNTDIVEKNYKKKMKEVFKRSPAWGTLILQGSKRGYYRLGI